MKLRGSRGSGKEGAGQEDGGGAVVVVVFVLVGRGVWF